jgi:hypothetical protein
MGWAYGGDFAELIHSGAHCISGLLWSDRGLTTTRGLYNDQLNIYPVGTGVILSSTNITETQPVPMTTTTTGYVHVHVNGGISTTLDLENMSRGLAGRHLDPAEPISVNISAMKAICAARRRYPTKRYAGDRDRLLCGISGCKTVDSSRMTGSSKSQRNSHAEKLHIDVVDVDSRLSSQFLGHDIRQLFQLDSSVVKPALLEAKQCMKNFECSLIGLKMLRRVGARMKRSGSSSSSRPGSVDFESLSQQNVMATKTAITTISPWRRRPTMINAEMFKPLLLRVSMKPFHHSLTERGRRQRGYYYEDELDSKLLTDSTVYQPYFRFSIVNNFDHIDDIETELSFHAVLLCRGMIVASAPMDTVSSGYVHKHHHGTGTRPSAQSHSHTGPGAGSRSQHGHNHQQYDQDSSSRHSIQELDCEVHFAFETFELEQNWLRMHLPIYRSRSYSTAARSPSNNTSRSNSNNWMLNDNAEHNYKSVLFGVEWPETLLLDTVTMRSLAAGALLLPTNATLLLHDDGKTSHAVVDDTDEDPLSPTGTEVNTRQSSAPYPGVFVSENDHESSGGKNTNELRWATLPESMSRGNWTLLVIAVTANHATYASKGHPMGFQQLDVTKHMQSGIASLRAQDLELRSTSHTNSTAGEPKDPQKSLDYKADVLAANATLSTTVDVTKESSRRTKTTRVQLVGDSPRQTPHVRQHANDIESFKEANVYADNDSSASTASMYCVPSLDLGLVDLDDENNNNSGSLSTVSDSPRYVASVGSNKVPRFGASSGSEGHYDYAVGPGDHDDKTEHEDEAEKLEVSVEWCNLNSFNSSEDNIMTVMSKNVDDDEDNCSADFSGNPSPIRPVRNTESNSFRLPEKDTHGHIVDGVRLHCRSVQNGGSANDDIMVSIDAASGMVDKILVNGINLLAERQLTLPEYLPSRLQLHRAATENDRAGFSDRWSLIGLDQAMHYVPNRSFGTTSCAGDVHVGEVLHEEMELPYVTMSPITGAEYGLDSSYQGVAAHWTLYPSYVNKYVLYFTKASLILFNS